MPALLCPHARRASLAARPGCPAPPVQPRHRSCTAPSCPCTGGAHAHFAGFFVLLAARVAAPLSWCCRRTGTRSADLSENLSARPSPRPKWSPCPVPAGARLPRGCAVPNQRRLSARCPGRGENTPCRHRTKDRLLRGTRTVWLLICVPLIQQMKTFPWARAVVNPPAVPRSSGPARLRGPGSASACGGSEVTPGARAAAGSAVQRGFAVSQ